MPEGAKAVMLHLKNLDLVACCNFSWRERIIDAFASLHCLR